MASKATDCVEKPAQCPYCGGGRIWYHGWYHRKEGNIPCDSESGVSEQLAIRRFRCARCRRTFSVRPAFLVFGHPFAAVAYEQVLQPPPAPPDAEKPNVSAADDAAVAPEPDRCKGHDWWQPGVAAVRALRRRLQGAAQRLIERMEAHQGQSLSGCTDVSQAFSLANTIAHRQSHPASPRFACHVLFLAIACTRAHHPYALTAA